MFTILVVEDEPDLQLLMKIFLKKFGYNVLVADNGMMAIEILREFIPDLILTDIMMPFMDGSEMIKEIKKNPHWSQIPILVATSIDFGPNRSLDVQGYLTKPVNFSELRDKLSLVLPDKQRPS
jgi:CheY-like chemotaxis protein